MTRSVLSLFKSGCCKKDDSICRVVAKKGTFEHFLQFAFPADIEIILRWTGVVKQSESTKYLKQSSEDLIP